MARRYATKRATATRKRKVATKPRTKVVTVKKPRSKARYYTPKAEGASKVRTRTRTGRRYAGHSYAALRKQATAAGIKVGRKTKAQLLEELGKGSAGYQEYYDAPIGPMMPGSGESKE